MLARGSAKSLGELVLLFLEQTYEAEDDTTDLTLIAARGVSCVAVG